MKIILSRKGFDSAAGGYPSPILPDGRLISLPIPSNNESFHYSDLHLDSSTSYYELMRYLMPKVFLKNGWRELNSDTRCHLDPDIYQNIINRPSQWKPAFGQVDAAQTHLNNHGIKVGDLFLFFGWFMRTRQKNGALYFDFSDTNQHVIFGYLQIGEIIRVKHETKLPEWISYHTHTTYKKADNNTIYIGRDLSTWDNNIAGAGVLNFDEKLVLTKSGFSRSKWRLPDCFRGVKISYHSEKSWKADYFQSAARGQEFVVEENTEVEEWARGLIRNNTNNT